MLHKASAPLADRQQSGRDFGGRRTALSIAGPGRRDRIVLALGRRLPANGFGYAAHDATKIVRWCTAEYVSDRRCHIGIETVAAYRRDLATLTAGTFVARHGPPVQPYWDSSADNPASPALAAKVGFERAASYSIFVGDFC